MPRPPAARLGLLLVLSLAVRLYRLDAHGLWLDEMISLSTACGGVLGEPIGDGRLFTPADFWNESTLPRTVRAVVVGSQGNGLLYHLLLRAWVYVAGASDFAVRLPCVVLGVLTVWWTFLLTREISTVSVARWAAGVAALHPLLIRYSQEARPYAMAIALTTLCTWLFARLAAAPGRGVRHLETAGYALAAAAAVLTHYLAVVVFAVHLAFALFARLGRPALRQVVAAFSMGGLLVSLWLPLGGAEGLGGMAHLARAYEDKARRGDPDRFLRPLDLRMVGAGVYQMTTPLLGGPVEGWRIHAWQAVPLFLAPAALATLGWRRRRSLERMPGAWVFVLALAVAPVAFAAAMAVRAGHGVPFLPRYGAMGAPYVAVILAFGLASGERVARAASLAQAVAMGAALLSVYLDVPRYRSRNPYSQIAANVRAAPQVEVVHGSWSEARMVNVHLPPGPLPRERVLGRPR